MNLFLKLFFVLLAGQSTAFAIPLLSQKAPPAQLTALFNAQYDFEGIVALSNCSGSLIRLETSRDTDKAMVLTNGHCLEFGMPQPDQVYVNEPSRRTFRLLNTAAQNSGTITATKLMYGAMTKTDMAIYQVRETFAEIKTRFGINPLTLSSREPVVGDKIEVLSGYWKRGFSCAVEAIVPKLKEGDWICEESIRYTRPGCEVYGGTSGSPIVLTGSRTVVGVNNTGNEDGQMCTVNNPCEIDEKGKRTAVKGYSYAQQTHWFYGCLNSSNEVDLNRIGCQLAK